MMLKPYTLNEVADMIQTAIDSAGDDKGHGVQGALDDLYEHRNDELRLRSKPKQ